MKRRTIILLLLAAAAGANAQQPAETPAAAPAAAPATEYVSHLQVGLGGGMHSLLYTPAEGRLQPCIGGMAEVQYQYQIGPRMGLAVGIQAGCISGKATYNYTTQTDITDDPDMLIDENNYTLTTQFCDWQERQTIVLLNVPVELLFRHPLNAKCALQAGIGATLALPLTGLYRATSGSRSSSAYLPATGVTYGEPNAPLTGHGFASYEADEQGSVACAQLAVGATVEGGFDIRLPKRNSLYIGLYCTSLFGSLVDNSDAAGDMLAFKPYTAVDPTYHGSMASDRVTGEVSGLEAGLKIALRLGMGMTADQKAIRDARRKMGSK